MQVFSVVMLSGVESQLLGRGVRRGNSTQNHALSGCARLIRLVLRCLL